MWENGVVASFVATMARGDRQSDIAAYFGINGGRVAEINTGQRGSEIAAAPVEKLPPAGPYTFSVRAAMRSKETLEAARDIIAEALEEIAKWEREG